MNKMNSKIRIALTCFSWLMLWQVSNSVTLNDFQARTQGSTPYRLFIPTAYDESYAYPIAIFLHGGGERGSDNSLQVTGQTAGPFCFAREEVQAEFPAFVVVPQMNSFPAGWTDNTVHANILAIIQKLSQEFHIDSTRIHITGNSMGGAGTVYFLQNDAALIASGAPVCPWFEGGNPKTITNAMDKPMWFFHGSSDQTAALGNSQGLVDQLRNAGHHVNLSVYKGVNHNSWDNAYIDSDYPRWVHTKPLGWKWPIQDSAIYRIMNLKSEKSLGIENSSVEVGATLVQISDNHQDESQKWMLEDQKNGYYKLIHLKSKLALSFANAKLTLAVSGAGDEQLFLMWEIGDRFKIVPKASHLSYANETISILGESTLENAQVTVSAYAGKDHQRFLLVNDSVGPVTLKSRLHQDRIRVASRLRKGPGQFTIMAVGRSGAFFETKVFDLSGRQFRRRDIQNLEP